MLTQDLQKLLKTWIPSYNIPKKKVKNLKLNSKKIKKGDLFIAIIGYQYDGRKFINQSIEKGAIAVVAETEHRKNEGCIYYRNTIPIIYLFKLRKKLSKIAGIFYNHPSKNLRLIGVTGTNGKTTITHLLKQWTYFIGDKLAVIGTLGYGTYNKLIPTKNTTSSPIEIQKYLYQFLKSGISIVAIEISSHSLHQYRVSELKFFIAIFVNLTQDHLDYHKNMKEYEKIKWRLFSQHKIHHYVINIDDPTGLKWAKIILNPVVVSLKKIKCSFYKNWMYLKYFKYKKLKTKIYLKSSWGNTLIISNLLGSFNITNILLTFSTLLILKYPFFLLKEKSYLLKQISGRMEIFKIFKKLIIIDYAHTPDALENALKTSKLYCKGKLWCIFGCGGNRDSSKRPIMASVAEKYANFVIITNDNPRFENPKNIINDIMKGFFKKNKVTTILSRKKAIIYSIKNSNKNDVILVTGKGHENYQIIGNKKVNFSDQKIIKKIIENKI